jgi:hypothetical protein
MQLFDRPADLRALMSRVAAGGARKVARAEFEASLD